MTLFLAMEPLEFLLRYTVVSGTILAIIGTAICMMAKRITMAKKQKVEIEKDDKYYVRLKYIGIALILIGMIVMVLPFEATFYWG